MTLRSGHTNLTEVNKDHGDRTQRDQTDTGTQWGKRKECKHIQDKPDAETWGGGNHLKVQESK